MNTTIRTSSLSFLAFTLSFAVVTAPARAAVPELVTWVGFLQEGDVAASGTYSVILELFDDATAGTRRFAQTEPSLEVINGDVVVELGSDPVNPLSDDVLASGPLFLAVTVDGELLSPRVAVTSAAYARRAAHAEDAETIAGLGVDDLAALTVAGDGLTRTGNTLSLAPGSITSAYLVNAAIGTEQLANNAVTQAKLAPQSVSSSALANAAVTAVHIGASAVSSSAIADGAITSADILDNTVGAGDIATNAVTSSELADDAVTAAKVAAGAIDGSHLKGNGVQIYAVSAAAAANCTAADAGSLTTAQSCSHDGCSVSTVPAGCLCVGIGVNADTMCPNTAIGRLVED